MGIYGAQVCDFDIHKFVELKNGPIRGYNIRINRDKCSRGWLQQNIDITDSEYQTEDNGFIEFVLHLPESLKVDTDPYIRTSINLYFKILDKIYNPTDKFKMKEYFEVNTKENWFKEYKELLTKNKRRFITNLHD